MLVRFSQGPKATEYGLDAVPRVGDEVICDNIEGTVIRVRWRLDDLRSRRIDVVLA